MAYATQTLTLSAGISARISAVVAQVKDSWARRSVYKTTVNELSTLSNRELADLGLSRSMIRSIAYEAAYK